MLIGDSRIRQLRDGLIYQLSGVEHDFYVNPAIAYDQQLYKKHESTVTRIPSANLLIEFFWSVEMDEEGGTFGHALRTLESKGAKPDMIIIGAGIWVMKVCTYQNTSQVECLRNFKKCVQLVDFSYVANLHLPYHRSIVPLFQESDQTLANAEPVR